jgi:hypothetical protein
VKVVALICVIFLVACGEENELCPGGQMKLFTPTPDITAFELAQLLSELRGWAGLGPPMCVKPDNHVPDIVAKYFRPVDRH